MGAGGQPVKQMAPVQNRRGAVRYDPSIQARKPLLAKWLDVNWYSVSPAAGIAIGNTSAISSTGCHYSIGAITQGTDRTNRVGRSIRVRALSIKAVIEAAKENLLFSGDVNNVVRVMLWRNRVLDPLTSGSTLTSGMFPVGDAVTGLPDADDVAEVYFDKTFTVQTQFGPNSTGTGTATQTQYQALLHEDLRMDIPIYYTNTGANAVEQNQIILSMWSDSTAAPHPVASCTFRVLFEDV